jgi:hypothetical protein
MRPKTYGCNVCWDVGIRTVMHPSTVAAIEADRVKFVQSGMIYTAAAKCPCAKGDRFGQGIPTFHSGMVPIPMVCRGTAEEQRQCYVDEYDAHRQPQDFQQQFN